VKRFVVRPGLTLSGGVAACSVGVPPGELLRIKSVVVTLTSDANAASRRLALTLAEDVSFLTGPIYMMKPEAEVLASMAVVFVYGIGVSAVARTITALGNDDAMAHPLPPVEFERGVRVQFTVDNAQAGDTLTRCEIICESGTPAEMLT